MTTAQLIWRIVNGVVMAPLFLLSVAVQYNDPDPIQWMLVYGAAAMMCIAIAVNRTGKRLRLNAIVLCAIALLWASTQFGSFVTCLGDKHGCFTSWDMHNDAVAEEAREDGGLLIVASWSLLVAITARKKADA